MKDFKTQFGYKISVAILVVALLAPSFIKLAHAFENHKHEICKTPQKNHYHELDLDCEFYKFKLGNSFSFQSENYTLLTKYQTLQVDNFYKSFYNNLQIEQPLLRGPPQLI